jgi:hypothetical protein
VPRRGGSSSSFDVTSGHNDAHVERRTRSLEPILEEVHRERESRLRHFDAMDAKAGIILGFSGALVALAPSGALLIEFGRLAAVVAAFASLATFWPRTYGATDVHSLRERYLSAHPTFTKIRLLDTHVALIHGMKGTLRSKALRLKVAMGSLATGVLLITVGIAVG